MAEFRAFEGLNEENLTCILGHPTTQESLRKTLQANGRTMDIVTKVNARLTRSLLGNALPEYVTSLMRSRHETILRLQKEAPHLQTPLAPDELFTPELFGIALEEFMATYGPLPYLLPHIQENHINDALRKKWRLVWVYK